MELTSGFKPPGLVTSPGSLCLHMYLYVNAWSTARWVILKMDLARYICMNRLMLGAPQCTCACDVVNIWSSSTRAIYPPTAWWTAQSFKFPSPSIRVINWDNFGSHSAQDLEAVELWVIRIFNQGEIVIEMCLTNLKVMNWILTLNDKTMEMPWCGLKPYNRCIFQQHYINWGGSSVVEREIAIRILQFLKHLEVPCSIHGRPFLFVYLKNSPASFFGVGRKNAE